MTTEEKAKAYNESIERAKSFQEKYGGDYIGYIFPELAESEDERIRTRLLEYFHGFKDSAECPVFWEGLNIDNILTWLEKQKDINCLACDEHLKGYLAGRKVTEEQKELPFGDDVVEEAEEYTSKVDCGEYGVAVTEAYIAGVLSERNRKPAEWSKDLDEEIKRFYEECVVIHEAKVYGRTERVMEVENYEIIARHFAQWQKEQQQERSEEQEESEYYGC